MPCDPNRSQHALIDRPINLSYPDADESPGPLGLQGILRSSPPQLLLDSVIVENLVRPDAEVLALSLLVGVSRRDGTVGPGRVRIYL